MNRDQLAHILRAASKIVEDANIVVLGSQAILGSHDADALPEEATRSIEADVAFWNDPDNVKSDDIDGAIGELSAFGDGGSIESVPRSALGGALLPDFAPVQ